MWKFMFKFVNKGLLINFLTYLPTLGNNLQKFWINVEIYVQICLKLQILDFWIRKSSGAPLVTLTA